MIKPDGLLLLTGGYSARDRGEDQAPFIVEGAKPLDDLKPSGAIGIALRWTAGTRPDPETTRAIAALCAAHPGPTPLLVEWTGEGNGEAPTARLRSRSLRVDAADDLVAALKDLLGADRVHLVRA